MEKSSPNPTHLVARFRFLHWTFNVTVATVEVETETSRNSGMLEQTGFLMAGSALGIAAIGAYENRELHILGCIWSSG